MRFSAAKIVRAAANRNLRFRFAGREATCLPFRQATFPPYMPLGTIEVREGFGPLELSPRFFDSLRAGEGQNALPRRFARFGRKKPTRRDMPGGSASDRRTAGRRISDGARRGFIAFDYLENSFCCRALSAMPVSSMSKAAWAALTAAAVALPYLPSALPVRKPWSISAF